jgi:hypothetical protein
MAGEIFIALDEDVKDLEDKTTTLETTINSLVNGEAVQY